MAQGARELISIAYRKITVEVPALAKLKLVFRLELRGRGDVQVYRVRVPGPEISKAEPQDARVQVSISRSHFNKLVADGKIGHWRDAYEHGEIKATGDPNVLKLIGQVVERHMARTRLKKTH
ncbi:MAG: hypothetical protein AABM66_13715 [Actinomycetota bacterium]